MKLKQRCTAEKNTLHVFRNIDSCQRAVVSGSSGETEKQKLKQICLRFRISKFIRRYPY